MRSMTYNDRLINWIERQSNKRLAKLMLREYMGVTQQTVYNWTHRKRAMSYADVRLIELKFNDF